MKQTKTTKIALVSLLTALSVVLGYFLKIPTPTGILTLLDAGIFSLNLAYALQSEHIGSCLLNGALVSDKRKRAEELIGCKPSEHLAMFVLVSKIPEGMRALKGRAGRKPIDEVFKVVS